MAEKPKERRTQEQRRAETRTLLMDTARDLFLTNGYDQTGMPELVRKAGLTRGALYHHFDDKADLFRAVAEREAAAIGQAIEQATVDITDPGDALTVGTNAYFDAMSVNGRATLLLSLAPAVLGLNDAKALGASQGSAELRDGLSAALPALTDADLTALTDVLSAGFDRAAQEIAEGADRQTYTNALLHIVKRLLDG
ncbi:TetR/AcrR family transcriptional regulator [Aliiroseovarius sp. YM-037]|uniref:TetR/AcrR family transcriptional regulator n=1 Tax=Aliiroseovarius sp. YM-037 TaxID=3341728 RepID=UPI003A7FD53A